MRRVVVGFSGGITSAWCAGWALRNFPREEVVLLFHDTKEEDPDTYRFLHEMAAKLDHPITERSDGRSVTEVMREEGMLFNDQHAGCSRILKIEQRERYFEELYTAGATDVILVLGFSAAEPRRIQTMAARAERDGRYTVRFPVAEERISKQDVACWVAAQGVEVPAMYTWSDHANCVGCVRGGKAYWLAVKEHRPDVFAQRLGLEEEFGHRFMTRYALKDLVPLKRSVPRREAITVGACECGD